MPPIRSQTSASQKRPQSVAEWQALLSDKPLPILLYTRQCVQKLISKSQISMTQYADPIRYDAGFCTQIFRHVNFQRANAKRHPLTTMDNTLSHFGRDAFKQFLNKTQVFEEMELKPVQQQGYQRVMQHACHASLQSRDWAIERNVMQPEEMQLAALMQAVPEMMLWCYGDNAMPEIEQLCYIEKMHYADAARKVLGCGMQEIGYALAQQWRLPDTSIEALSGRSGEFTLATGVSLLYDFARCSDINWYGKNIEKLLDKIASYKGKKPAEVERRLHMVAIDISDEMQQHGYLVPARLLPLLADDDYKDQRFVIKPERAVVTAEDIDPREGLLKKLAKKNKPQNNNANNNAAGSKAVDSKAKPTAAAILSPALTNAIKQFHKMVAEARKAPELIEFMVKSCLLTGVERVVFLVKVPDKDVLVTRYSEQQETTKPLKPLKIATQNSNVFSLLIEKNSHLFLNQVNREKYWASIPHAVKLTLGVQTFFAMSIFVGTHPMGIMYADKPQGDLSKQEYMQFQMLCKLLSRGIAQAAQNK